jgi:hypothetical protein
MRALADRPAAPPPSVRLSHGEVQNRMRLAHGASSVPPWTCRSCGVEWPCEARLHFDEVSADACRRYADQVHADQLAGYAPRSDAHSDPCLTRIANHIE